MNLANSITIGINLCEKLQEIHMQKGFHGNLNNETICIKSNNVVEILDTKTPVQPYFFSPEQTGRINRSVDYRTDIYSLGVFLYHQLIGVFPFDYTDELEMVHAIIAKSPKKLYEINQEIPFVISEIIMKMLAKNIEERYQTVLGLMYDLEKSLIDSDFKNLGEKDISSNFIIPQKLYGREKEIKKLIETFHKTTQGIAEMLMVTGYSGIGKTSLVNEIQEALTLQNGYFISGKFDQFKRNVPYSSLIEAFEQLVKIILTENESKIAEWKTKICSAVGENGKIVTDIIPDLELITGQQKEIQPLAPTEAQNRFNYVFEKFIRVFAKKEHPLTLFIDDLQWIDSASLKLLELFATDNQTRYLFLIGAYRDNEVDDSHPVSLFLNNLHNNGKHVENLILKPLCYEDINFLIADTFHCDLQTANSLAEICYSKTNGNPYFLYQFLHTLYERKLLIFNHENLCWTWNIEKINLAKITDNVVVLMLEKIRKTSETTQNLLSIAAVIGETFDLEMLLLILEKNYNDISESLHIAVNLNFIEAKNKYFGYSLTEKQINLAVFRFSHDRIQQAAYSLIDEEEKNKVHYRIGQILLTRFTKFEFGERIFDILNHLNRSSELIHDSKENLRLIQLNLLAAKKAKLSIAYDEGLLYAQKGIQLLADNSWSKHYELTLNLLKESAQIEFLIGNFENSKRFINQIMKHAKTSVEKAEVLSLLSLLHTMNGEYEKAIKAGSDGLHFLGMDLPNSKSLQNAMEEEIGLAKDNLQKTDITLLYSKPDISDEREKLIMSILGNLDAPCFYYSQALFSYVVAKRVNLSIQKGNSPASCMGYATFGLLSGAAFSDFQTGINLGNLGMSLSDKYSDSGQKCKTSVVLANYLTPWVKHIKFAQEINEQGFQAGLIGGEMEYAGYNLGHMVYNDYYQGKPLESVSKRNYDCFPFINKTKNRIQIICNTGLELAMQNLLGKTVSPLSFSSEDKTEIGHINDCKEYEALLALCEFYIFKAQILFLYNDTSLALSSIQEAEKLITYIPNKFPISEYYFYHSLILTCLYTECSDDWNEDCQAKLAANQKQMKIWADNCPENFLHKYLLIEAEIARVENKSFEKIIELYDKSIEASKESEFIQNEAIANELAAKYLLSKGKIKFAEIYLSQAYTKYKEWGAIRKVNDFTEKYSEFLKTIKKTEQKQLSLDLQTIIKVSQSLSSEVNLHMLIKILMKLAQENAGAQRGILILGQDNNWFIEAEMSVNNDDCTILKSEPYKEYQKIPHSVINFVINKQQLLVLENATSDTTFNTDNYIISNKTKSVFCQPLISQRKMIGALYLENNLTSKVFTHERVELLKIITAQAATSIEKARLYENLESKVQERTEELEASYEELAATNEELQLEIEEHEATENALKANEAILKGVNITKDKFFSIISHDLKSPFNTMLGFSDLLIENNNKYSEEKRLKFLKSINHVASNTFNLLDDLLAWSRSQSGKIEIKPTIINIRSIIFEIKQQLQFVADKKQITIELPEGEDFVALGDIDLMNTILRNLLSNAVKFSHFQGTIQINTSTISDNDQDYVKISIIDNGVGIPASVINNLFKIDKSTSTSGTDNEPGTGLGLILCKEFVELNKGQIGVESEIGIETVFWFTIPVPT